MNFQNFANNIPLQKNSGFLALLQFDFHHVVLKTTFLFYILLCIILYYIVFVEDQIKASFLEQLFQPKLSNNYHNINFFEKFTSEKC